VLNTVQKNTGVALVERGACERVFEEEGTGRRSAYLLAVIDKLLDEQGWNLGSLDAIAVCTGPGTFTGIRVGMAVARALAYGTGLPLVGVTAFDAYQAQWFPSGTLVLCLDARRGEVYTQVRRGGAGIPEPSTQTPEALKSYISSELDTEAVKLNGDALGAYGEIFEGMPGVEVASGELRILSVISVAEVAAQRLGVKRKGLDPLGIQPSYIRRSDKELQLK